MTKKIILTVDDVVDNIAIIQGILGETYTVKAATNAKKALEIAEKKPSPDLILLDVIMPEMDGYELCQKLKRNDNTRRIPVLFVTAKVTPEDKQKSLDVGGLGHITKPIDQANLLDTIEIALATGSENY